MSTFSKRLTNLRESKNYSKTKLANMVGVALSTYANWEYGYNDPDMDTLTKLANVLNTTVDYLTGRTDNPATPKEVTDGDLDKMLDDARSYDGKPMTKHDRVLIKQYLEALYGDR